MQRLALFGGISIETAGGPLTGRAVQRRRLALLALLAAARTRGVSRDKLIAYLWPDADAENGRRYLSDSVYRINQALGGDAIVTAGDELRLDAQRLPSDLAELEEALARGDYERVASLYAGPFLDGFFLPDAPELERWVEVERSRLADGYARALGALGDAAERRGDHAAAATCWRRLAAHDPYNSRVALRLMQSLRDAGERAAAIQHARVHETLLRSELELEPDRSIAEFAERLRSESASGDDDARATRREDPVARDVTAAGKPHSRPESSLPSVEPALPRMTSPAGASPDGASTAVPRSRRAALAALGAAGVVTLLVLALWARDRNDPARAPVAPQRTIAVLPFANLSPEPENEYFSDGMTEELIATLGTVDGLQIASRTSAFAYKNRPADVREVGKALGVEAVVEGSVRKAGRTLRITAQLVSTANGYRLWSGAYDREVEDVFAIQEEISRAIVAKLTGELLGADALAAAGHPTGDAEAYELYLRGRFAWHQRTRQGLAQAIEYFGQAIERDPTYARAYAGLGDAYAVSAFYDYRAPRDAYPKAASAARRALELDPNLAAPHATLGYVRTYYDLDWPRAESEFKRALALDPSYSTAHQWYANLLTVAARFDEAEREMRLAQETDPLSLIASAALGWSFYYGGRYADAVDQCRRTLALDPDYVLAHLWGGWAHEALGRRAEARAWIGRAVQLSGGSDLTRLALAHLLAGSASSADRDTARAIVRSVESRASRGEYVPSYEVAKVHLALGDRDEALRWLERAVEERSHSRAFLRVDPQWAMLRGTARFEGLVERAVPRDMER